MGYVRLERKRRGKVDGSLESFRMKTALIDRIIYRRIQQASVPNRVDAWVEK
jgi:hypothetical protein